VEQGPQPILEPGPGDAEAARAALQQNPLWYHTIDLAPGVTTPGQVDLREVAPKLLPPEMAALRALDVGTFDGFWAFEMEKRGASVVAIDVDSLESAEWPPVSRTRLEARAREWNMELGRGFGLAARALGSAVDRVTCSVYDLEPGRIGGRVGFAFSGAVLLHLRDPVRALERIRGSLEPRGRLVAMEPFSIGLTLRSPRRPAAHFQPLASEFNWWLPNLGALSAWLWAAGFTEVRRIRFLRPPAHPNMRQWYVGLAAVAPA
jgi:tRNA (mo5U34)-methyltransferase